MKKSIIAAALSLTLASSTLAATSAQMTPGFNLCKGPQNMKRCELAKSMVDNAVYAMSQNGCQMVLTNMSSGQLNEKGIYMFSGNQKPPYNVVGHGSDPKIVGMSVEQRQAIINKNNCKTDNCTLNLKKLIIHLATVAKNGPTFVEYKFFKTPFKGKLINKISYIHNIRCGNNYYYVGAGFDASH